MLERCRLRSDGRSCPFDALPLTDLDLAHESRITEDENLRFSMPVSVLGRLRKRNRGGKAYKIGDYEVNHLRGQGIELVNLGEAGRVRAVNLATGFARSAVPPRPRMPCPDRNRSIPEDPQGALR